MKAVAAGDEIAGDLVGNAVLHIGDARMVGVEIMRRDVGGAIYRGQARRFPCIHQVERDLGLAVDHHGLAGRAVQVDAVSRSVEGELQAVMHQPLAVGPRARADLVEQRHRTFLEQPRPDAAEHIIAGLPLEDHVVDAVSMQELTEQKPCRTGADDDDFGAQAFFPRPT